MSVANILVTTCESNSKHYDKLQTLINHANYDVVINTAECSPEYFTPPGIGSSKVTFFVSDTDMGNATPCSDIVICTKYAQDGESIKMTDNCAYVCSAQREDINDLVYITIATIDQDDGSCMYSVEHSHHYVDFIKDRYSK